MTDSERPFDPSMPSGQFQTPPDPHQGTGAWATQSGQPQYGQPQYGQLPPDLPPSPYQSGQPQHVGQQQTGPYGAPQFHNAIPPTDKSVGAAVVLTFLFGSLGLFYSSVMGGIVMTLVELVAVVIGVLTLGVGFVLFVVIWPATMVWGALSASRKHRNFELWRVQQMQLAMQPRQPH